MDRVKTISDNEEVQSDSAIDLISLRNRNKFYFSTKEGPRNNHRLNQSLRVSLHEEWKNEEKAGENDNKAENSAQSNHSSPKMAQSNLPSFKIIERPC